MKKIILIKEPNLLWDEIIHVLQKKLPHYSVRSYDTKQYEQLKASEDLLDIELIIIDTETNIDLERTKQFYHQQDVKIAIWASKPEHQRLTQLFKLGFDGYLFNEMEEPDLFFAVRNIVQGKKYVHPDFSTTLLNDYIEVSTNVGRRPSNLLTPREWDVLELIAKGQKNKEIAECLFVSSRTVNNHIASILKKLNVPDKTNAAILAFKKKWFKL